MATVSAPEPISSSPTRARRADWLAWIDRVHPSLTGEDRVRSALLARMIFVSATIGILLLLLYLFVFPEQLEGLDLQFLLVTAVTLPMWFVVNRRGQYQTAYRLFVLSLLVAFSVPTYVAASSPSQLAFTVIPFLLAGIFFSQRSFILLLVGSNVWIGLMLIVNADNPDSAVSRNMINYLAVWFFLILVAFLISTFVVHLRALEADRRRVLEIANQGLRESEMILELRVQERTRALEAARVEAEAARAQAESADRVKSQFLASMSHELRTPLNAIINFTRFVARGTLGPVNGEQEEALNEVIDSSKHLLSLINDVLDMSKIEAGSLRLFVEDNVNVNQVLQQALNNVQPMLAERPIALVVQVPPALPTLRADRQRILQVFLNILANACKYTDAGTITVCASSDERELHLSVTDTGPGIKPEDYNNVFESFKQTDTGLRKGGGTGLGMPISRSLVEAHGGRLWFESAVGVGTTFYVALPLTALPAPTPEPSPAAAVPDA